MTATSPGIYVGATQPADTSVLWLSTSHKDMRISNSAGDRRATLAPTLTWEGAACQEPSVWYGNGKWNMYYTGGSSGSQYMGYASAPNPTGPWTKNATPVLGNGNNGVAGVVFHTGLYVEDSTIYVYWPHTASTWTYKVATAPLSDPTALTVIGSVFTPPGNATGQQGNTALLKDTDGTYLFFYEAPYNNFQMGIATGSSPTGPFTHKVIPMRTLYPTLYANGANLAIQNGGPQAFKDGDTYVLYYHGGPNGLPTQGYRATSTDLINWTIDNAGQPFLRRVATQEVDQVADLSIAQAPGGNWVGFWTGQANAPTQASSIMYAPMLPVLKWHDGNAWVPCLQITDTNQPKTEFVSSFVATSNFTTTTVGSDVAVTGLALTYTPTFNCRAVIRMRMKVSSSAAGSVLAKIAVTPTTYVGAAPGITYATVSAQEDDMPASSTSFRTINVDSTVNLIAGTQYAVTGYVNNAAVGATTTVASGGQYSEIELLALPN